MNTRLLWVSVVHGPSIEGGTGKVFWDYNDASLQFVSFDYVLADEEISKDVKYELYAYGARMYIVKNARSFDIDIIP